MKLALIAAGMIATSLAFADMDPNMDMGGGSKPGSSKFAKDMDVSMKKMDKDMMGAPMTGNVDHDFASMMIPHHQGAIDMAKAELAEGKDPEMRELAKKIIAAQKVEIAQMKKWMASHSAKAESK